MFGDGGALVMKLEETAIAPTAAAAIHQFSCSRDGGTVVGDRWQIKGEVAGRM
jgi:hypothetical protein